MQAGNLLQQKDTTEKVILQLAKLQGTECDWIEKDHLSFLHSEDGGTKKAIRSKQAQGNDSAPKQVVRLGSCWAQDVANA